MLGILRTVLATPPETYVFPKSTSTQSKTPRESPLPPEPADVPRDSQQKVSKN